MFWFLLVDFDKVFVRNKVTKELAGFQAGINGKCEASVSERLADFRCQTVGAKTGRASW